MTLVSEIMGKRICVKLDGSWLTKLHLDKAQQNNVEHQAEIFLGSTQYSQAGMLMWNCEFLLQTKMTKNIYIHTYTKLYNRSDQM